MSSRARELARSTAVRTTAAACLAACLAVATGVATAGQDDPGTAEPVAALDTLALPNAFQPEGIAIGAEPTAFFGSLADGSIFAVDLVTGEGEVISEGPGTPSVGLKVDAQGRLFVAGGRAGDARVIDTATGEVLSSYVLATEATSFVNDVVLTPQGAFFTDSANPVLYHLPLAAGADLPAQEDVVQIPLTGDIVYQAGNNANGIALTPDGRSLLIVQTNTGLLFRVDPATGVTEQVTVAAADGDPLLPNGDGLLVLDQRLFVVQNRLNTVAVLAIDETGSQAEIVDEVTDPRFDVPTTVASFEDLLYLPNARFGTEVTPDTEYLAVGIPNPAAPPSPTAAPSPTATP